MKKKRFTEAQIVSILHQQEAGKSEKDISREHGISDATSFFAHIGTLKLKFQDFGQ